MAAWVFLEAWGISGYPGYPEFPEYLEFLEFRLSGFSWLVGAANQE